MGYFRNMGVTKCITGCSRIITWCYKIQAVCYRIHTDRTNKGETEYIQVKQNSYRGNRIHQGKTEYIEVKRNKKK